MGLIEVLSTPRKERPTRGSRVDAWAEKLSEGERAAVYEAAKNPAWGHTALCDTFVTAGMAPMSATAFQAWRHKNGLPRPSAR